MLLLHLDFNSTMQQCPEPIWFTRTKLALDWKRNSDDFNLYL